MENPTKKRRVVELGAGGVEASLEAIPRELLSQIMLTLDLRSLLRLRATCKTLRQTTEDALHLINTTLGGHWRRSGVASLKRHLHSMDFDKRAEGDVAPPQRVLDNPNLECLMLDKAAGLRRLHVPRTLKVLWARKCHQLEEITGLEDLHESHFHLNVRKCRNLKHLSSMRSAETVDVMDTPSLEAPVTILDTSRTWCACVFDVGKKGFPENAVIDIPRAQLIGAHGVRSLHLGPRCVNIGVHDCDNLESVTHETGTIDDIQLKELPSLIHVGLTRVNKHAFVEECERLPETTVRALTGRD